MHDVPVGDELGHGDTHEAAPYASVIRGGVATPYIRQSLAERSKCRS